MRVRVPSVRDRVQSYRERQRAKGLRPIQIWVPDVRSKAFVRAAHRQAAAIAKSSHAAADQAFIDAIGQDDA